MATRRVARYLVASVVQICQQETIDFLVMRRASVLAESDEYIGGRPAGMATGM